MSAQAPAHPSQEPSAPPPPPPPQPIPPAQDPTPAQAPAPPEPSALGPRPEATVISNSGSHAHIDVTPDHRYPLMSWIYSTHHDVPSTAYDSYPHASPASLIGYTYALYISLLFHNDAYQRPSPSTHARALMNSVYVSTFYSSLLDCHVPPFAEYEFEAYRLFTHDIATNLSSLGSEAGFSFEHDFGRFFTIGTFFGLHNLSYKLSATATLSQALHEFAKLNLFAIRANGNTTSITPGHLFGLVHEDTASTNWFNNHITQLVSTQLQRTATTRRNASTIPMSSSPTSTIEEINPYFLMMSATEVNLPAIQKWITDLNDFTRTIYPTARTLRSYLEPGNPETFRHLIFELPPPTWHSLSLGNSLATAYSLPTSPFRLDAVRKTHNTFTSDIDFRTTNDIPQVTDATPGATTPHAPSTTTGVNPLRLVRTRTTSTIPNTTYNVFSSNPVRPTHPDALIFEPISLSDATSHHVAALTSGKLIESGDITAILIQVAHPRRNLMVQNTHFFEGAIPLSNIQPAFPTENVNIRNISTETLNSSPPTGFTRGNNTTLDVPQFPTGTVILAPSANTATNSSSILANATTLPNVTNVEENTNAFLNADFQALNLAKPIPFWSSFRHYDATSHTWIWLPTLRHIFGTQARIFGTRHPSIRLPS
ncbi:capsid protein [Hymenoscyphus fraxineus partitivirus 1]|nr:capsid protein [Hymenoscyphus fraxineus partitivirus 1]